MDIEPHGAGRTSARLQVGNETHLTSIVAIEFFTVLAIIRAKVEIALIFSELTKRDLGSAEEITVNEIQLGSIERPEFA